MPPIFQQGIRNTDLKKFKVENSLKQKCILRRLLYRSSVKRWQHQKQQLKLSPTYFSKNIKNNVASLVFACGFTAARSKFAVRAKCSASIQKSFVKKLEALSSCRRFVWDGYLEVVVKDCKEIVYENKVAEGMCRVSCVSFIKIVQDRIRHWYVSLFCHKSFLKINQCVRLSLRHVFSNYDSSSEHKIRILSFKEPAVTL